MDETKNVSWTSLCFQFLRNSNHGKPFIIQPKKVCKFPFKVINTDQAYIINNWALVFSGSWAKTCQNLQNSLFFFPMNTVPRIMCRKERVPRAVPIIRKWILNEKWWPSSLIRVYTFKLLIMIRLWWWLRCGVLHKIPSIFFDIVLSNSG